MKNFLIGILLMISAISITAAIKSYSKLTEMQTSYRRLQLQAATQVITTEYINK